MDAPIAESPVAAASVATATQHWPTSQPRLSALARLMAGTDRDFGKTSYQTPLDSPTGGAVLAPLPPSTSGRNARLTLGHQWRTAVRLPLGEPGHRPR